jgi:hypothetical protein
MFHAMSPRPERRCACGHTRAHPMIAKELEYSLWGWICISIIGITPKPERIVFRCTTCRKAVGVTRDPRLLRGDASGA